MLTTTAVGASSPLITCAVYDLKLSVNSCPTAWVETRTATGFTYACSVTPPCSSHSERWSAPTSCCPVST